MKRSIAALVMTTSLVLATGAFAQKRRWQKPDSWSRPGLQWIASSILQKFLFERSLEQRSHYVRPCFNRLAVAINRHRSRIFHRTVNSRERCLTM